MVRWQILFRLSLIGTVWLISLFACSRATTDTPTELPSLPYAAELQAAIDQVMAVHSEDFSLGISAAVVVPGYQTWTGVSGYSQPGVPITSDMLFNAGSVEKNFQAALVLKLVEEGALELDDPVSKYLPPLTNVDGRITIRQLLNHTSGVFNVFEHPQFPWARMDVDYARKWGIEEVFNTYVLEPYGAPGYAQHYSSTNYLLLTKIIEKATGSTVPDEVEKYFLHPLRLEHTYFSMGEEPPQQYSLAHPWVDIDQDGTFEDLSGIPLNWIVTLTHPVIFSTAEDLARWMNALYYEQTVLSQDSLDEMLSIPQTTLRDPDGAQYGLGVVDYSELLGVEVFGHGGSALGYSAAVLYYPEYGVSVAWLFNTGESPYQLASQIMGDTWRGLVDVLYHNQFESP